MKRADTLPGAPQPTSALTKTSDKSDKTSIGASFRAVLSLLSSISRRSNKHSRHDLPNSAVDSVAKPERPMSRAEATE
jgi:hypothetical protein